MNTFYIILNVVVLIALIGLLIRMQQKHYSFSKRVFTGLGLGILLGVILQAVYGTGSDVLSGTIGWYNIVGSGYVQLLMMIVVPLVMVSIIQSIINLEKTSDLGKMSTWIIGSLVSTAMAAALVGVGSAAVFDLNAGEIESGQAEQERGSVLESTLGDIEDESMPERILSFVPSNIFQDMTQDRPTSVIAVVIFSMIVGIAVLGLRRKNPEEAERFTKGVNTVFSVVMRIVTLILRLTPFGILALISTTVASTEMAGILQLGKFVIASYAALLVMFLIHLVLIGVFGLNPMTYLKKVLPVLSFAFTSRSSAGTIH
ncbi:Sodium:dicarboxylate symporter family protein [Salibacterium qingdaonense]|uniref:L-cystine uptake protein TcyP n=1 Tax=Salibacterium qingdaonense TaxID=266892 RepID=A0A1I4PJ59_9BACI|nr:Sodium:dicarboxylate symporter family protein [Salibacterium qingdaonense]